MNLKSVVLKLFIDSKRTPIRGLSAIAEAEKFLQQAYDGRYFFELIQNVRDANREIHQDGDIFISFENNKLVIANTGGEFSKKGIESITTIGQSTKKSQDFIGFKGIGFKSIQEISNNPSIITRYGTVEFNRKLTLREYKGSKLKIDQIPLFYFPHFTENRITEQDSRKGIVTKIELPIKDGITTEKIINDFKKIESKQLILLGYIKNLEFHSEEISSKYVINQLPGQQKLEVIKNDSEIFLYKNFSPIERITIPNEVIESLEGKEKELFKNSSQVDIKVVISLNENGQIQTIDDANLYLFYPLQISSGFRFLIHSYFIVNPERTALRESPLNDFLLKKIGNFIGEEVLRALKKSKSNTTKILTFKRNNDAKLDVLYSTVIEKLKNQKFIFDNQSKNYYAPDEVMVADGFDKGLFSDGSIGDKTLIYVDDALSRDWLITEFTIPYLTYNKIAEVIEIECKKQQRRRNIRFFQTLYNYVGKHDQFNLTGRKVLLTDQWRLVSSDDDVFYGGIRQKSVRLSSVIKRHIHFIHKEIKLEDIREGKSRTGIIEYNTFELVRRLLKLFDSSKVPNIDIINALYSLELDSKSEFEIKEKILFPVNKFSKWLSPIYHPIYFKTDNLIQLYPNGYFVDESVIQSDESDTINRKSFLAKFGIWNIPALFISERDIRVSATEKRETILTEFSQLVSRPFYIKYDRILDKPETFNSWFTQAMIENWDTYKLFICSESFPKMQYYSAQSGYSRYLPLDMYVALTDFAETLRSKKWIVFAGEEESFNVKDVVGINPHDFHQPHNQVIKRYIKLLPVNFLNKKELITSIECIHLDGDSIRNFETLFKFIHEKFKNDILTGKEFIDFFNRVLSKLVDFYLFENINNEDIEPLKKIYFLSINDITKETLWKKAEDIYYIDDKPNYDLLPLNIREKIQPQFTNRDKNTFGRIAAKIGRKFSDSLQKALIPGEPLRTISLVRYFEYFAESLAILESSFDIVLNKEIEVFKNIQVIEKQQIRVRITISGAEMTEVEVNHFIDRTSNFDIHLSISLLQNRNRTIAETITDLFTNVLDRDIRKFNSNLLLFLNNSDKLGFLRDYEVTDERVQEIKNKLTATELSDVQKFWNGVLMAKGLPFQEQVFIDHGIDTALLADQLQITPGYIQKFTDQFNFQNQNNNLNINVLAELLNKISITLALLNDYLYPKIDFKEHYNKKLLQIKNKFQSKFEIILYKYLISKNREEQEKFQDLSNNYNLHFHIHTPLNSIKIDIENTFFNELNKEFTFLPINSRDIFGSAERVDLKEIYKKHLKFLKKKLENTIYDSSQLEIFLSFNKHRSLLYFSDIDYLYDIFNKWLKENQSQTKKKPDDELDQILTYYSQTNNSEIESTSVRSIALPGPGGGTEEHSGGHGRRVDGGAGQENKALIGIIAEMLVFDKLHSRYKEVRWVSKNASKIPEAILGYNPEGDDSLHYDIEYLDDEGNKFYIEVKGRNDDFEAFEISRKEIEKANELRELYKVIFVSNTMDIKRRRIRDLGNLFQLPENEDFLFNSKFTVLAKNFEIRFQ